MTDKPKQYRLKVEAGKFTTSFGQATLIHKKPSVTTRDLLQWSFLLNSTFHFFAGVYLALCITLAILTVNNWANPEAPWATILSGIVAGGMTVIGGAFAYAGAQSQILATKDAAKAQRDLEFLQYIHLVDEDLKHLKHYFQARLFDGKARDLERSQDEIILKAQDACEGLVKYYAVMPKNVLKPVSEAVYFARAVHFKRGSLDEDSVAQQFSSVKNTAKKYVSECRVARSMLREFFKTVTGAEL